jgi:polyisoprenyl-teichoic acid--peptidoglycan teichoic acid transferase
MPSPLTPPAPPSRPRKSGARRVIVGILIFANVAVFGTLGAIWFAANQVSGAIPTIPAEGLPLAPSGSGPTDPKTFLLVGSDRREGLGSEFAHTGYFGGERSDVIMLVTVRPREGSVQMLSIPRDLKVVYGGVTQKINGTFSKSAGDLVAAVTELTGAPIHHYLQVDFGGFAGIVDAIGGVEMTFPYPARDLKSHLSIGAGTQTLNGQQALALARSRSYQEQREGGWVSVDGSDFGRTRRQQDILMAIITQIDPPSSPAGFNSLLDALAGFVTTDSNFREDEIINLAWSMRNIQPEDMDTGTLPAYISNEGGVSYVVADQPAASEMIAAFVAGRPIGSAVGRDAAIEVQNGNGRSGAATQIGSVLTDAGFDVVATTNSTRSDYATTLVVARAKDLGAAEAVVAELGYGRAVVGRTPDGVDLLVIVGLDAPTG